MDEWMNKSMDGWMDERMDVWADSEHACVWAT